jgi:Alpha/beta hydrolase of unknown function (DUF900)
MTVYLNFRSQAVGGAVVEPYVLRGDGTGRPVSLAVVDWWELPGLVAGRNVLFGVHGFNVNYAEGACALGQLDAYLSLAGPDLFVGVLWPGDSWLPVVNYPFEGEVSIDCGRRLAEFCSRWFGQAQSLSFVSHSLGARLVLETVTRLDRRARGLCLTAGAVNNDCLTGEYTDAAENAGAISLLASRQDWALKVAFLIGDPIADILHDDHAPFHPALGYGGPRLPAPPVVLPPWQIPDSAGYGHGDYLPPTGSVQDPATIPQAKWPRVADFVRNAFKGGLQSWP